MLACRWQLSLEKVPVVGFDIYQKRIDELKNGQDHTLEVSPEELKQAVHLNYTAHLDDLQDSNFYSHRTYPN